MRKKAVFLFLLKLTKVPLNLFLLSISAKYFGVSFDKDMWLLGFTTMAVVDAAIWGPINETFRSRFIFLKEGNSENYAIRHTQSLLTYFFFFSLVITAFTLLFPYYIASFIAPAYNEFQLLSLVKMIYWSSPILLLNQMMQIGLSVLNAYGIFYVGEISGFVSTIINIILIYLFAETFGIFSLAIAYYISTFLLILFIVLFIIKNKIPLFKSDWDLSFVGFKSFFLYAVPFFLPYFFGQINGFVEKILAGKLDEGTISILDFSNRIPNLMYGIVMSVITTLLVPVLSRAYIHKEKKTFNTEFQNMFRLGILIIGFIFIFVLTNATSIVNFLYGSGEILPEDLRLIANLSITYSFSLFGIFSYIIFGMSLLSSQKEKKYAFLGMFTQIGVIVLNFVFYRLLDVYIFPISVLISHLVFSYFMYRNFPYRSSLNLGLYKYILMIVLIGSVMYCIKGYFVIQNSFISIIIFTSIIIVLLSIFVFLFKIEERKLLRMLIKKI